MVFFRTVFGPASCSAYIELGSVNLMHSFVYAVHSVVVLSCVFVYLDQTSVSWIVRDCICSIAFFIYCRFLDYAS